jgi:hypothetical protein
MKYHFGILGIVACLVIVLCVLSQTRIIEGLGRGGGGRGGHGGRIGGGHGGRIGGGHVGRIGGGHGGHLRGGHGGRLRGGWGYGGWGYGGDVNPVYIYDSDYYEYPWWHRWFPRDWF